MAHRDSPQGKSISTASKKAVKAAASYDRARSAEADESHPPSAEPQSGTMPTASDRGALPVTEPGSSVDPEDLGRQFLRDATEQDNFESSYTAPSSEESGVPLGQVISEATLRAAGQDDVQLPASNALDGEDRLDGSLEPATDELDLISDVITSGSLFDHPTADGDVVSPNINADEMAVLDQHQSRRKPRAEAPEAPLELDDEMEEDSEGRHDDVDPLRIGRS